MKHGFPNVARATYNNIIPMEQEENYMHLLREHSFLLFCVGALLILGLLFAIGVAVGKRNERNLRRDVKNNPK